MFNIQGDFGGRSFDFCNDESIAEYPGTVQKLFAYWGNVASPSPATMVAKVIWDAAHDETDTLRFRAGRDADLWLGERKAQDDATFIGGRKREMKLGTDHD